MDTPNVVNWLIASVEHGANSLFDNRLVLVMK